MRLFHLPVYMCTMYVLALKVLDPLELKSQMIVSLHLGAGN